MNELIITWQNLIKKTRSIQNQMLELESDIEHLNSQANILSQKLFGSKINNIDSEYIENKISELQEVEASLSEEETIEKILNQEPQIDELIEKSTIELHELDTMEKCLNDFLTLLNNFDREVSDYSTYFQDYVQLQQLGEAIEQARKIDCEHGEYLEDIQLLSERRSVLEKLQSISDNENITLQTIVDTLQSILNKLSGMGDFEKMAIDDRPTVLGRKIELNLSILRRIDSQLQTDILGNDSRITALKETVTSLQKAAQEEEYLLQQTKASILSEDKTWFRELLEYYPNLDPEIDPIELSEQLKKEMAYLDHVEDLFRSEDLEWNERNNSENQSE